VAKQKSCSDELHLLFPRSSSLAMIVLSSNVWLSLNGT
jgi:hypothetical protein